MLEPPNQDHAVRSPDDSPIFIIGTGRSGTTLLRQILNAHPRIHITHEAGLYSYEPHAPKSASASEFLEHYFETFSFRWLGIDPQEVRAELPAHLPRERIAEGYRAIMRCKARQLGKPRYGEKNPLITSSLGRIFRDFPDPRIVYIMRDPRPTVLSFNRMPFTTPSALLNAFVPRVQFAQVKPYLDRIFEVRLEDLVADPRTTLRSILRFVGEPWDDAVLDHVSRTPVDDVPPMPWFQSATREAPSSRTSDGGWRERLSPVWIRLVERINRDCLTRYGYEPAQLAHEPGLLARVGAVLRDIPGMTEAVYRLLLLRGRLDGHFHGRRSLDPQRELLDSNNLNPAAWRHYPDFQMPQIPQFAAREESASPLSPGHAV